MSDHIKDMIPDEDKEESKIFIINPHEVNYLRDLDNVFNSFAMYQRQLMTNYLKGVSKRLGYSQDKNLQFDIDLKNPKRELTITEMPWPDDNPIPPLHKED